MNKLRYYFPKDAQDCLKALKEFERTGVDIDLYKNYPGHLKDVYILFEFVINKKLYIDGYSNSLSSSTKEYINSGIVKDRELLRFNKYNKKIIKVLI